MAIKNYKKRFHNHESLTLLWGKKLSVNQRYMVKIAAIDSLSIALGLCDKNNPYKTGKIPYEKDIIMPLFQQIHTEGLPVFAMIACSRLLDWYFPEWRDFATKEVVGKLILREDSSVKKWRKEVLYRDNNACVSCGSVENLQAHHILDWARNPEARTDLDNGITLCGECHHQQHEDMSIKFFV